MLALKDPRLELLGVTTVFGNCPPDLGARCAAAVLKAAKRGDVPVAIGMATRMGGDLPQLLGTPMPARAGDRVAFLCPMPRSRVSACTRSIS